MINKALKKVEEVIKLHKGNFLKKCEPKVIGEKEEAEAGDAFEDLDRQQIVMSDEEDEEGMDVDIPGNNLRVNKR